MKEANKSRSRHVEKKSSEKSVSAELRNEAGLLLLGSQHSVEMRYVAEVAMECQYRKYSINIYINCYIFSMFSTPDMSLLWRLKCDCVCVFIHIWVEGIDYVPPKRHGSQ